MDHSDASGTDPLPWVRPEPPEETEERRPAPVPWSPSGPAAPPPDETAAWEPPPDETAAWEPPPEERMPDEASFEAPAVTNAHQDAPAPPEPHFEREPPQRSAPEPERDPPPPLEADDLRHKHIAWVHLVEPAVAEPTVDVAATVVVESPAAVAVLESFAHHEPAPDPGTVRQPPAVIADWSMPAPSPARTQPDHLPSALGRLIAVVVTAGIAWAVLLALGIWVAVLLLSR